MVKLFIGEVEIIEGGDVLFELLNLACADEDRGYAFIAQDPGKGHLGKRLAPFFRKVVEGSDLFHRRLR